MTPETNLSDTALVGTGDSRLAHPVSTKTVGRTFRNAAKRVLHRLFVGCQNLGVDILPRHYYSNIPHIKELRTTASWREARSMIGVAGADLNSQLAFIEECCDSRLHGSMCQQDVHSRACRDNGEGGYGPIEADFLYCFVAQKRPGKIVQVGAGVSTAVILHAASTAQYHPKIVCIDPYPTRYLKEASEKGLITLVREKAQEVDLSTLIDLNAGDLLFVDSTHAVKVGSEVNRLMLEVLPRLKVGCYVHFHDIYFPYDYPASLFDTVFFWTESILLHAFLINNSKFSIVASLSMLHHARSKELQVLLPNYRPAAMSRGLYASSNTESFPNSIYLRVIS